MIFAICSNFARLRPALAVLAACGYALAAPFLVKPYLQLGSAPEPGALSLLWHGPDQDAAWTVEVRPGPGAAWRPGISPAWTRVSVPTVAAHRVYQATLRALPLGGSFDYRVRLDGKPVFQSRARGPKGPEQTLRVAVAGDLVTGKPGPQAIAYRMLRERPDLVLVPGDLVYEDGRIGEYRDRFYPVYNADRADPAQGAPLLRSTATVGVLGNHDVGERGPRHPQAVDADSFAYYLYWNQPLNGPAPATQGLREPPWSTSAAIRQDFLAAAGPRFPTMGSFSFDSGGVHWTVLDSNPYMRWDSPALQEWLTRDLERARGAHWRVLLFHHPAFNFSVENTYQDQWMGRLWPLLERNGVDLVLNGHVHTYVRSRPLSFQPDPASSAALDPVTQKGELRGQLTWDQAYDGLRRTRAKGIIQVITGAGGAHLHLAHRASPLPIQPYVASYHPEEHSFSLLEISARRLSFRQLNAQGRELDRFILTR